MTALPRGFVGACALVYAAIGVWTLVDPQGALAEVGVRAVDDRGLVELRAMYGGLELGLAAFLGWALLGDPARVRAGLVASTLTLGGLGATRALSWLVLRPEGWLLPVFFAVELGGAAMGAFALYSTSPDQAGRR